MDLLKAEIARKKKLIQESAIMAPNKKYFKRGDLAAKQEEQYWKKHKRFKTDHPETVQPSSEPVQTETVSSDSQDKEEEQQLPPKKEIIRRLRERNEPIILFGETELLTYQRLHKLEIMQPEINKGYKNDMKSAMERVDEEYLQEIMKASGETEQSISNNVQVLEDNITLDEILNTADKLGTGDEGLDSTVILKFFKLLLKLWAQALNDRPVEEKRSFRGKLASATHSQTVSYMKPLFRSLKRKTMTSDILSCLVDIVRFLLDRDYIKANDAYLEMAIGNAPWPIGVTMVGIHARTGREKIFARNVAHVLNDETQRKYIQAVKRLMTHCQRFFPTDPSRSVDYEGEIH